MAAAGRDRSSESSFSSHSITSPLISAKRSVDRRAAARPTCCCCRPWRRRANVVDRRPRCRRRRGSTNRRCKRGRAASPGRRGRRSARPGSATSRSTHAAQQLAHAVAGVAPIGGVEQRLRPRSAPAPPRPRGRPPPRRRAAPPAAGRSCRWRRRAGRRSPTRRSCGVSSNQRAPKRCVSSTARPTATRRPPAGARPALTVTNGLQRHAAGVDRRRPERRA